jgi:hypothetical protein
MCRVRVLDAQRLRKLHETGAPLQIIRVLRANRCQVRAQRLNERSWQQCRAILGALTPPHENLPRRKVDIFHPQAGALQQPHPRPVKQRSHQLVHAIQLVEHGSYLLSRNDYRKLHSRFCVHNVVQ